MRLSYEFSLTFKEVDVPVVLHLSLIPGFIFLFFVFNQHYSFFISFLSALLIYVSIFLHELGHLIGTLKKGVKDIKKMYVHFLGATLFLSKDIKNGRVEGYVALSGPLVSIVLSYIFYSFYMLTGNFAFNILSLANFLIGGLNLLPVYPLDGGRVLRALLLLTGVNADKVNKILKIQTFLLAAGLIGVSIYFSVKREYLEFVKFYLLGLFLLMFVGKDIYVFIKEKIIGGI